MLRGTHDSRLTSGDSRRRQRNSRALVSPPPKPMAAPTDRPDDRGPARARPGPGGPDRSLAKAQSTDTVSAWGVDDICPSFRRRGQARNEGRRGRPNEGASSVARGPRSAVLWPDVIAINMNSRLGPRSRVARTDSQVQYLKQCDFCHCNTRLARHDSRV